jgi:hypothetical protein
VLRRRSDKGELPEKFKTRDIVDYLVRELEWVRDELVWWKLTSGMRRQGGTAEAISLGDRRSEGTSEPRVRRVPKRPRMPFSLYDSVLA